MCAGIISDMEGKFSLVKGKNTIYIGEQEKNAVGTPPMRVGYGYRRTEKDFADLDCQATYVDTPKTDRAERAWMFQAGLRPGDVLVMLGRGDLGYGLELRRLRERLERMNVAVECVERPKPGAKPAGRPPLFDPAPEHDAEIRNAWHDEDRTVVGVLKMTKRLGYAVEVHQLKHRYGNRFKGTK